MTNLKVAKWLSLITGIILLIAGVLYLQHPESGVALVTKLFALSLLFIGILRIVRYFSANYFRSSGFLLGGVLDILLAIFILSNISVASLSLSLCVAVWVLFGGINEILLSFDVRRHGFSNWWVGLLGGILSTIFGVLLLANPALSTLYVGIVVAVHIFLLAIGFISMFFALKKREQYRKF